MLSLPDRAVDVMGITLKKAMLKVLLPKIVARAEESIKTGLEELVIADGQSVENQISSRYEINDRDAVAIVEVHLGPISGSYTANISGSPKVADHVRTYEDSRPWEFPDGHWETSKHIPSQIALQTGNEALKTLGY